MIDGTFKWPLMESFGYRPYCNLPEVISHKNYTLDELLALTKLVVDEGLDFKTCQPEPFVDSGDMEKVFRYELFQVKAMRLFRIDVFGVFARKEEPESYAYSQEVFNKALAALNSNQSSFARLEHLLNILRVHPEAFRGSEVYILGSRGLLRHPLHGDTKMHYVLDYKNQGYPILRQTNISVNPSDLILCICRDERLHAGTVD